MSVGWIRLQPGLDGLDQFADPERFALDLVVALGIDKEGRTKQLDELSEIEFGDQDGLESFEKFAEVAGEGVQVSKVGMADRVAALGKRFDRLADGTISATPTDYQDRTVLGTEDILFGD